MTKYQKKMAESISAFITKEFKINANVNVIENDNKTVIYKVRINNNANGFFPLSLSMLTNIKKFTLANDIEINFYILNRDFATSISDEIHITELNIIIKY